MTDARFGAQLRALRIRHRISLRELANRVHVDYGHLGKVERGSRTANRRLVEACEVVFAADGALRAAWLAEKAATDHRPAQLPSATRLFVGRHAERRQLATRLTSSGDDNARVLVVAGPPGVGKTTLVLRCANDVSAHFPDGIVYADLRGHADEAPADPHEVLEQFLLALGVPAAAVPRGTDARASLYRSVMYDRRVLVVLDNVDRSEQIRPLLPSGPGCGVLVSSRARLPGLTVLLGAPVVDLAPLPADEAVDVLRGVVGAERVDAEPEAAATLAGLCSGLPLALRAAAEQVAARPRRRLADLLDEVATETAILDLLTVADDPSLDVRRVFSWSYRALSAEAALLFRLLGLHWGSEISLPAAATLAGWTIADTRRSLDVLTAAHLLQEVDRHRYQYHDLLRAYAAELAGNTDSETVRHAATDRLRRWYLVTAHAASQLLGPCQARPRPAVRTDDLTVPQLASGADAAAWYDRELPALVVATKRSGVTDEHAASCVSMSR